MRAYAGRDPVTKKRHNLVEVVEPGLKARDQAEAIRARLFGRGGRAASPAHFGDRRPARRALPRPVRRRAEHVVSTGRTTATTSRRCWAGRRPAPSTPRCWTPSTPNADGAGVDVDELAPGGLWEWVRTSGGEWLGVVTCSLRYHAGRPGRHVAERLSMSGRRPVPGESAGTTCSCGVRCGVWLPS